MKIKLTTIHVNGQDKALRFYSEVLGFQKKADFSQGPIAMVNDGCGNLVQIAELKTW